MAATLEQRERFDSIKSRKSDLKDKIITVRRGLGAAQDDPQARATLEAKLAGLELELDTVRDLEAAMLHQLAGMTYGRIGSFFEDPETIRSLESLASSSMPVGNLALGPAMGQGELVGMIQSGAWKGRSLAASDPNPSLPDSARMGTYYGIVQSPRRRLSILDYIPTQVMSGNSFQYTEFVRADAVSASGAPVANYDTAAEVAEATVKPVADVAFRDAEVVARTVAHWTKLRRQQLADVPGLQTVITDHLSYGVLRRVENQIVGGDGVGENLLGIVARDGVGSVPYLAGPYGDYVLEGITDVLLTDAQPDAVVINPTDLKNMLIERAEGSGEYLASGGPFGVNPTTIWGLPAIASTAMPAGQALVGDFGRACTLWVREGVNVRVSDSDQDDFVRNRVTLLGEGRFGLAVWSPASFCLVHLAP